MKIYHLKVYIQIINECYYLFTLMTIFFTL
nr:MAG TPA: hypothetical protein [Bacteriophage sp.]